MGWTWYNVMPVNGKIDRKAECDKLFAKGYKVLKSRMVGRVHYAAVEKLNGESSGEVFAAVTLTGVNMKDYFNFGYKDMTETMEPYYYDCPASILDLLTPTDNERANTWRRKCRETIAKKKDGKSLSALPVGTEIEFECGGRTVRFWKCAPAYQFKRPFWSDGYHYIPHTRIPENFRVVTSN